MYDGLRCGIIEKKGGVELEIKTCSICGNEKTLDEFYKQSKENKKGEKYYYYHPSCKECEIKKSVERQKKHPQKHRDAVNKQYATNSRGYRDKNKAF